MLTLNDGRKELYQWDTGRTATVELDCDKVHFSNMQFGRALVVEVKEGQVKIPDELLMSGADLLCWAFVGDAENGFTKKQQSIKVNRRAKPLNYTFTPTEQASFDKVFKAIGDLKSLKTNAKSNVVEAINEVKDDGVALSKSIDDLQKSQSNLEKKVGETEGVANKASKQIGDLKALKTTAKEDLVNAINEVLEKTESNGGGNAESVVKDWNVNDPNDPRFIENRTHYVTETVEEFYIIKDLPLISISGNGVFVDALLEEGEAYLVKVGNVTKEYIAEIDETNEDGLEVTLIGDTSDAEESNHGFSFVTTLLEGVKIGGLMVTDEIKVLEEFELTPETVMSSTVTVSKKGGAVVEAVKKLDNKFIDAEWMAKVLGYKEVEVLPLTEFTDGYLRMIDIEKKLVVGDKVKVTLNGVVYEEILKEFKLGELGELSALYVGDLTLLEENATNVNPTFLFLYASDGFFSESFLVTKSVGEGSVSLSFFDKVVNKLPSYYLEDDLLIGNLVKLSGGINLTTVREAYKAFVTGKRVMIDEKMLLALKYPSEDGWGSGVLIDENGTLYRFAAMILGDEPTALIPYLPPPVEYLREYENGNSGYEVPEEYVDMIYISNDSGGMSIRHADNKLDATSRRPVQNKVVAEAINSLQDMISTLNTSLENTLEGVD